MRPARADERGRERGRDGRGREPPRDGRDPRDRGGRGDRRPRPPGERDERRRRPKIRKPPGLFDWYKFRTSHVFVFLNTVALLLVLGLWTFPSYVRYRNRERFTTQYCVVRSVSNQTGCVGVEFVYVTDSICDPALQNRTDPVDCSDMCVYSERQTAVGVNATTVEERQAFVGPYLVGAEVPCYYPRDGAGFPESLTFARPYNPNDAMFQAIVWLLPFLLALTVSVACMLRKPRAIEELEDSEMLSGLFDEVITGRDRQRRFAEQQDAKLKSVLARVEREQEKRLDVQQAIDKTKKDLVYSQDELRSSMNENLRSLESKLVSEMAQRLSKIPIPDKLKAKVLGKEARRGRDRDRDRDRERLLGDRPDSAASIYEEHRRGTNRRDDALADDVEAQRSAFQRRLEERRGRDEGRDRDRERRGRSKSRNRR